MKSEKVFEVGFTLTYGFIWDKRLVIKAKYLSDIVEIGMLCNKCPLCVVHPVVKVSYGNLYPPILLVIELDMPVHPYRTHMACAL